MLRVHDKGEEASSPCRRMRRDSENEFASLGGSVRPRTLCPRVYASAEARATLIQGVCPLGVLMIRDGKLPLLHNVPVRLSSFIGRVQDSAEVAQLLAISRLVTLTGAFVLRLFGRGSCGAAGLSLCRTELDVGDLGGAMCPG